MKRIVKHVWKWLLQSSDKNFFNSFIFLVFILFQALDGLFTYFGINIFGIGAEANLLIRLIVSLMGVGLGLTVSKFLAIAFCVFLYYKNLHRPIAILMVSHMVFAVFPWAQIFLNL